MEEEILATAVDNASPVETGGWLWSPKGAGWWGMDGIDVHEASGPGPDAEKAYGELTLQDSEYLRDLNEMFTRDDLELAGGWHVHHGGDPQPSSVDLDPTGRISWVLDYRARLKCRTQRALEIVVCRSPGSASWDWTPHPYVFYRGAGPTSLRTEGIWPEPTILKGD